MKILQKMCKCGECGYVFPADDVLEAPNPFDVYSDEVIEGCPKCKTPENILRLCDEPGCQHEASCGTPTKEDGYRRTCHLHIPSTSEV